MTDKLVYAQESYAINGACFNVYADKGCGFLEAVYQECLEIEFRENGIPFEAQKKLRLEYRGQKLQQTYAADFVCCDRIIVEIKAVDLLASTHKAQVLNYLHASGMRLGLLVNFGHYPKVEIERILHPKAKLL